MSLLRDVEDTQNTKTEIHRTMENTKTWMKAIGNTKKEDGDDKKHKDRDENGRKHREKDDYNDKKRRDRDVEDDKKRKDRDVEAEMKLKDKYDNRQSGRLNFFYHERELPRNRRDPHQETERL